MEFVLFTPVFPRILHDIEALRPYSVSIQRRDESGARFVPQLVLFSYKGLTGLGKPGYLCWHDESMASGVRAGHWC